jgi:hypothetical protein
MTRGPRGTRNTPAKPLWQCGLDWLRSTEPSTHPTDRDRAYELAKGLRKLNDLPPWAGDVSNYAHTLWNGPHDRIVIAMVRDCWSSVWRARTSRGRARHSRSDPLAVPDMLIRQHLLTPSTEDRLAAVARDAMDALIASASLPESRVYQRRKAELSAALESVDQLRKLRARRA